MSQVKEGTIEPNHALLKSAQEQFNPIFSFYKRVSHKRTKDVSLTEFHDIIKTGSDPVKKAILELSKIVAKSERSKFKSGNFEAVSPSGIFEGRRTKTGLTIHSGIMCADFDGFKDESEYQLFRNRFEADEHTLLCFRSPSGLGLKVFVKVPPCKDYKEHYLRYEAYKQLVNNKTWDEKCKDVCRPCFIGFDPDAYLNQKSKVFTEIHSNNDTTEYKKIVKHKVVSKKTSSVLNNDSWSVREKLEACIKVQSNTGVDITEGYDNWLNMAFALESEFGEGGRNYYHEISSYSHEYDEQLCDEQYNKGLKSTGTGISIGTLFRRFNDCGVKFADELIKDKRTPKKLEVTDSEQCPFTYESVSKDGETTTIKFSTLGTLHWLESQGFSLAKVNGVKEFVRVHNRIIEVVEPLDIKNTVISFCKSYDYLELTCVVEKLRSGYEGLFESLGYKEIPKRRKVASKTHFYFNNCIVVATEEGFKKVQYKDYDGYAFKTELIDKDFKENHTEGHYQKFCEYVFETDNMDAVKTSLGYLLHEHNSGTDSFMIFVNDKEFDAVNHKANGGKGKGIFESGPKAMLPNFLVDGKKFKADNQFQFSSYKHGARLCVMPDIKPKFNLTDLNVIITEGLTVEKKGQDSFFIESEDSPKFILDSNYVQKTDEGSIQRRMKNLYINNRYTNGKKPIHDFGKEIFKDWEAGDVQWDMFHTFMIKSTVKYIKDGIIDQIEESSRDRLLISCTNDDFYNFAFSDIHGNDIERYMDGVPFNLNKEIASYKDQSDNYNLKVSPKLFKTWIQALADFHMCGVKKVRTEGMHKWVFTPKI